MAPKAKSKTTTPKTVVKKEAAPHSATRPDAVTEKARLGGSTVEELKDEKKPAPSKPAVEDPPSIRLDPPANDLLIGETHTAIYALGDVDPGDVVTFSHPNGFNVRASVYNGEARGTFLVERAGPLTLGFRVNGKSVAEATFETR